MISKGLDMTQMTEMTNMGFKANQEELSEPLVSIFYY